MITPDNVEQFLRALSIPYKDVGNRFSLSCPLGVHEDKNPSFSIYKESKIDQPMCICFACRFSGTVNTLCKMLVNKTLYEFLGLKDENSFEFIQTLQKPKRKRVFPDEQKEIEVEGTLEPVAYYKHVMEYLRKRSVDSEAIDQFQIRYSRHCKINGYIYQDRIAIPIIEKGKVISYELRDPTEDPNKKKVLYPKGGSVSTLFNVDSLDPHKPLIVVEGIMDIWKIWRYITKNVTCTFGIHINSKQKKLLSGFPSIILMPDGDEGGDRFIGNLYDFYENEFQVAAIPRGKDPGDCNKTELIMAISKRKDSSTFMLERYELLNKREKYSWKT